MEAYGPVSEEAIIEFPKANFPSDLQIEVGLQLMMNNGAGQQFPVTIKEIKDEVVVLDANHSLAGKDLIFDLELVEIAGSNLIIMP